jgi:DNA polymerase-3 subunit epsilon
MSLRHGRFIGFGPEREFPADLLLRLSAWGRSPRQDPRTPAGMARFAVVDVETTGLDISRDRLLAIGAVDVQGGAIPFDSGFERVLRQETASDPENILVHRIAGSEQLAGEDPAEILVAFLEHTVDATLVGFHTHFDDAMLRRAFREHLGLVWSAEWLDLALLGPAVAAASGTPLARNQRNLDAWLQQFDLHIAHRHNAVADALGTAQLLQVLLPLAASLGAETVAGLQRLARVQRWLA